MLDHRPLLSQSLNPLFADPCIHVCSPLFPSLNLLLDCGQLTQPHPRLLNKVTHLLVSHTHIDHFIGFDTLLRLRLYSDLPLTVFGPKGIGEHIQGKLKGYAWNKTSQSTFAIHVYELDQNQIVYRYLPCANKFIQTKLQTFEGDHFEIHPHLTLSWCPLVHGVPCLAYRLDTPPIPRINKKALKESGLTPGPWLAKLLASSQNSKPLSTPDDWSGPSWQKLAPQLIHHRPAYRFGYMADTVFDPSWVPRWSRFFDRCDELWCEATYLHQDHLKAKQHAHLTAAQSAYFARQSNILKLQMFHLSKSYDDHHQHLQEAKTIFFSSSIV